MMGKSTKGPDGTVDIPFCVGRSLGISLARQIADGIRSSIETGHYKPGQVLPTRKEFARALGVSERAPREAVALLAAEGLVYTRRCLGCVVAKPGERQWLGRVLLVLGDYDLGYYYAALFEAFSARMIEAGYMVTRLPCPVRDGRKLDVSALQSALRQSFDLVISLQTDKRVVSLLRKSGVRHQVFSYREQAEADDEESIFVGVDKALADVVGHCERRGVKSIIQVGLKGMREIQDLRDYVLHTGIRLVSWDVPSSRDRTGVENITYGAMQAFADRLAHGRRWLPDVLFFRDDYIAVGALTALLQAGVRVPEDVRVVTVSNRGNSPVFPKSLARIELDPERNGTIYAERALHVLEPARFKRGGIVAYRYLPGDTFP